MAPCVAIARVLQNDVPKGGTTPCVAIVQSGRPKSGVSLGATSLQATSTPKLMPTRAIVMLGAAIIRPGDPNLGFLSEHPESDATSEDDAF
jgi:hypothetical protein